MKTSLLNLLSQAKRFIASEISGDYCFPHGFRFAPRGQLAYELVLDASPSMLEDDYPPSRFAAAKKAATSFLHKCVEQTPDALIGVIFYAQTANVAAPLLPAKMHLHRLREAIDSGEFASTTNIGAGLIMAGQELMTIGSAVSAAIVLLTDGYSNVGPDPVQIASQLKEIGVRLDIIGIGGSPSQVNEAELKDMASVLDGELRYWFIRDKTALVRKFEALALGKL